MNINKNSTDQTLVLEMGYTPNEFSQTLNGSFCTQTPYTVATINDNHWQVAIHPDNTTDSTGKSGQPAEPDNEIDMQPIDIRISEKKPRVVGMLRLPVLQVSFNFAHMSTLQQERFLKRFFQYFHKGGG